MKVLFAMLHFGYERNFESVIRELARRGHHVHVAVEKNDRDLAAREVVESIARECPTVTVGELPGREDDQWRRLARSIRLGFDYLRYLQPEYAEMPGLRMRSQERVPVGLLRVLELPGMMTAAGLALVRGALARLERALPPSPAIDGYLQAARPDVMLITPLIGVVASSQFDYVTSARRLGIPVGFCVCSWDNLSSKALIREVPDAVFVWNDTQRDEAVALHRVPPSRVIVSGAQCYDQWFGRTPSRTRAEFCRYVGLPADRAYVLYVCSTMVWHSPPEADFVVKWITHLRSGADPRLREVALLVRPHPTRLAEWEHVDVRRFEGVAFAGGNPLDSAGKADYFDALYYAQAVVGINTSAFIEAGIIGRPVYAILTPEFSGTQEGTIHFRYLTQVGGGIAKTGRGLEEHAAQLSEELAGRSGHEERRRRFLEAFVRPQGLDVPATPAFADAVEALARRGAVRDGARGGASFLARRTLGWLAEYTSRKPGKEWLVTLREVEERRARAAESASQGLTA